MRGFEDIRALTRAMCRGDEEAWRAFHDRYHDLLVAIARGRGIDDGEVADVIQRSYLRILRHLKPFDEESDFRAWVCCLLRSEVIDSARKRQRRRTLVDAFREWAAGGGRAVSHGRLLEGMARADRRLLERHYEEGWSQAELAAEAGVSVKAMESKLARVRRRARRWLEGNGGAA